MRAKLKQDAESSRGSFCGCERGKSECELCEREGFVTTSSYAMFNVLNNRSPEESLILLVVADL